MSCQLYDILPNQPFGRGTTTSTISSDPCIRCTVSAGSSGSKSLTLKADGNYSSFSNGDLVLIHQTTEASSSTGVANWEVNEIASGGGTVNITLENKLSRTYTNSYTAYGKAVRAQIVKIPEYNNLTMNSFTGYGWRGPDAYTYAYGGIVAVAVKNNLTISGTPNLNGKNGWATTSDCNGGLNNNGVWFLHSSVVGGGFRPGWNSTDGSPAGRGEGFYLAATGWTTEGQTTLGNGAGGASTAGAGNNPGGGGGNGSAGSGGGNGGTGGGIAGSTTLTSMHLGGGGGGGHTWGGSTGSGGGGGGIFVIWAKNVTVSGGLQARGGVGGNGQYEGDGGSGAGGSILINCQNGTFGSSKVNVTGGAATGSGGAGGNGRVRINYSGVVTGTTSPSASTAFDGKLVEPNGAFIFNLI